jgi:OOP family OmpA-OmpF porin
MTNITLKIVKIFFNTFACLMCFMNTNVAAIDLPSSAKLVASDQSDTKNNSVAVSTWDRDRGISRLNITGKTVTNVYQIDGTSLTLDQMLKPIINDLKNRQFSVELYCKTQVCGGFNFRKNLEIFKPPFMLINVANYSVATAKKNNTAVSLIASKLGTTIYLQVVSIGINESDLIQPDIKSEINRFSSTLITKGAIVLDDLTYRSGSSTLGDGPFNSLLELAKFLKSTPTASIILVGHSDSTGELSQNIELSKNRAQAVADRLIKNHSIEQSRISAQGIGFLSPKTNNSTEKSRKKNRRVEAVLILP